MNEREFAFWLRGYFELVQDNKMSEEQVKIIREHLDKVFNRLLDNTWPLTIYTEHPVSC